MGIRVLVLTLLCLGLLMPAKAASAGIDLHEYWDQRCKTCHGHSAEFARRFLRIEGGRLAGVHHRTDLERFLRNHYLNDDLLAPVSAMLRAQVETPPLFGSRCARCHGNAAEFARASLAWRGDTLIGTAGARPVAETLTTHGALSPGDAAILLKTLSRVRNEVSVAR